MRNNLKLVKLLTGCICAYLLAANSSKAQADGESASIEMIDVTTDTLPDSTLEWTKIICDFKTTEQWSDGVSINYLVLVKNSGESDKRLLTGGLTYMNVPAGTSRGVIYLSPNATLRYGEPLGIKVEIFRGDRIIGEKIWGSSIPEDVQSLTQAHGILKSVYETPWLTIDAAKSPDLLVR